MSKFKRVLAGAALAALGVVSWGSAHAALIGIVQTYPDVSLSANTLIYDNTGVNASTGLLRVVSLGSTLNRAPGAGTLAQSYAGTGDSVADVMLSFAIDNTTGALVTNSTFNKVSIGFGNSALTGGVPNGTVGFSWQGNITQFGFSANGNAFDARWTVTADQYRNMPAGFGAFVDGYLTGGPGGLNITSVAPIVGSNIWAFDWVRGQFAGTSGTAYLAQIAPYTTSLSTTADRVSGAPFVDVFVPLPAAAWFMFSGLMLLAPAARRRLARA